MLQADNIREAIFLLRNVCNNDIHHYDEQLIKDVASVKDFRYLFYILPTSLLICADPYKAIEQLRDLINDDASMLYILVKYDHFNAARLLCDDPLKLFWLLVDHCKINKHTISSIGFSPFRYDIRPYIKKLSSENIYKLVKSGFILIGQNIKNFIWDEQTITLIANGVKVQNHQLLRIAKILNICTTEISSQVLLRKLIDDVVKKHQPKKYYKRTYAITLYIICKKCPHLNYVRDCVKTIVDYM